jgi:membrane-bound serine protease (ClpP class)
VSVASRGLLACGARRPVRLTIPHGEAFMRPCAVGHCHPRLLAAALVAALWLSPSAATARDGQEPSPPLVIVAEVDAIIHPVSAEFMVAALDRADAAGAAAIVFVLRTPGGLVESTRTIVSRMIEARTPVVVFVAPAGARAASAGFILVLASDVAAMAPGTHIGAAHPVSASGEKQSDTLEKKAASDVAAYARSLAEARHRNVALANEAVVASRAFTEHEAAAATPPLVDLVTADVSGLLKKLDGRTITRFDGRTATLSTANARVERFEMTRRQRFLSAIAHPQVAFLLMSLGLLGLTVELWNPGAIAPGVVGGIALLLAFFAFQVIPANTAGLLLIALGIGLLALELKIPSFGALGVGGGISLVLGSVLLTGDVPGVRVGLTAVLPVVLAFAAIFLLLGRLALRAQQRPAVTGEQGMIGQRAVALSAIAPGATGSVAVHGETWRARAEAPVSPGDRLRVVAIDGLTLTVEPAGDRPVEGVAS